jgi:hypothetical protein
MDYMLGLSLTKHGNKCVFVVVDQFSKMTILAPYKKSMTVKVTFKLFFEHVWVHFGIPWTIILDRDTMFFDTFWSSLWSLMDTKLTTFHPKTNGHIEVINMMILHILSMYNYKHPCT